MVVVDIYKANIEIKGDFKLSIEIKHFNLLIEPASTRLTLTILKTNRLHSFKSAVGIGLNIFLAHTFYPKRIFCPFVSRFEKPIPGMTSKPGSL